MLRKRFSWFFGIVLSIQCFNVFKTSLDKSNQIAGEKCQVSIAEMHTATARNIEAKFAFYGLPIVTCPLSVTDMSYTDTKFIQIVRATTTLRIRLCFFCYIHIHSMHTNVVCILCVYMSKIHQRSSFNGIVERRNIMKMWPTDESRKKETQK